MVNDSVIPFFPGKSLLFLLLTSESVPSTFPAVFPRINLRVDCWKYSDIG